MLEEPPGQLTEELASCRVLNPTLAPTMEECQQAAGRFGRYDKVRRAILQLQNSTDEGRGIRDELGRNFKLLLNDSEEVTKATRSSNAGLGDAICLWIGSSARVRLRPAVLGWSRSV